MKQMYGWVSAIAIDHGVPLIWYTTPEGTKVAVTCVEETPDITCLKWTDARCIGPVDRWLRTETDGPSSRAGSSIPIRSELWRRIRSIPEDQQFTTDLNVTESVPDGTLSY